MKRAAWRWAGCLVLLASASPSYAQLLSVTGSAECSVEQIVGSSVVQSDFGQEIVPTTKAQPPATGRARLDRFSASNDVTAAGQGVAIMYAPNTSGVGNPSDIGMEVGAFTDDEDTHTGWRASGHVRQTRSLQLAATDSAGQIPAGNTVRARSRLLLSGALILFSQDKTRDLTGCSLRFNFHIDRRQPGRDPAQVLEGSIEVLGGPNGAVTIGQRTGALNAVTLPVIDLRDQLPELPLVLAVVFQGINFDYVYEVTPGEPFELELVANSEVQTLPGGIGANAVFGVPQDGIGGVFQRVKQNDLGTQVAQLIAQHVDTTGASYASTPSAIPNFAALCAPGTPMALAAMSALLCGGAAIRRRRRRRATFGSGTM